MYIGPTNLISLPFV